MQKQLISALIFLFIGIYTQAQSGTEFWLAPPEVTIDHNSPGDVPIYLNLTSFGTAATVTISQPANPGFTPIVVSLGANDSHRETLSAFKADLETAPTNTILTTGLLVESTATISAYYEVSNTNNPDMMSLKGENGLGTEFYIPLHRHAPFFNHTFPNFAYSSFDIVATEDNTTVLIFSPVELDGHPALTPFTIVLDRGETYSAAWTGANYTDPSTNPAGAAVVSDKPIAISIKDDSVHNPSGGCFDFMGDQIIPVGILGKEYVAIKGFLNNNGDESAFVMASENNTKVFLNGSTTEIATLFAGQYYRVDMDSLSSSSNNSILIETSRPSYVNHVTGFGCESGMALLPPMNCAGSEQVSFVRSTNEGFFLNIMIRAGSENDFVIAGSGTATIDPSLFIPVPGTGGTLLSGQFQFNTTEIPVGDAHLISNSSDVFTLGIINGGGTSGCRYGYFSEFVGVVEIDAGADETVCVNQNATLSATVDGGASTGIWTTSGSGSFTPNDTDLNATYNPSAADYLTGSVTLTITSTGQCEPESDSMELTFQDEPQVDAGIDEDICSNNAEISLDASIIGATGGTWSGGSGSFAPNNAALNAVYTPTNSEVLNGSVTLTLTSNGNGNCTAQTDDVTFTFTQAPTINAGADQSVCVNNANIDLSATATVASGGFWSGGAGSYSPSNTFLNSTYTPTAAELSAGSISLTVTTSGVGNCAAVSDDIEITFTMAPSANAGSDGTFCANNSEIILNGSVNGSTGGEWSGGLGSFGPDNSALTGTYTPSASELSNGSATLTLSTTGNGNCVAETDDVTFTFTDGPIVEAGSNESVCANAPDVNLNGTFTIATGVQWTGGLGTFTPSASSANATYSPTPGEIAIGSVTLTLTTTGNGSCNEVTDSMTITYTPSPSVEAGENISACENNASIDLSGSVAGAPSALWSGGAGTFSPNATALDATYEPIAAEILNGSVQLTLTSSGAGTCSVESDNMTLSFTTAPTANAGSDTDYCENNAAVSLAGDVDLATGGQWTGGNGSFNPDATTLTTLYTPSAAELAAGSVTLTLVTTGNGNCASASDPVTFTFTSAPTIDAGISQTLCANNADADLQGSQNGAGGVLWTGGLGTFSPNANDPQATYTPVQSELDAGTVSLNIETIGNGTCLKVEDQVTMNFTPAPTIAAGTDQSLCENNAEATLNGTVSIATGAEWSGGAGTFTPDNTTLNATYNPTQAEIDAGTVNIILTSTGNGNCAAENSSMELTFTSAPSVEAGITDTFCENNSDIILDGSFADAGGIQWSGGLGTFVPDAQSVNAVYSPSQGELDAGSVTLTLSSTDNGGCVASTDDVEFNFTEAPTADAGLDQDLCQTVNSVQLGGSFTLSTGAQWSGGAGSFLPSNTDVNAQYFPTETEKASGILKLTLTTVGNGTCNAVEDDLELRFQAQPFVNAGSDLESCANNAQIDLSGFVGNALGAEWLGGTGDFFPNNSQPNAEYSPSPAEIAAGSVTLTYTTTGNGFCAAETDVLNITIIPAPEVDAGTDISVCSNNPEVNLTGNVIGASGGIWSNGFGSFSPSETLLNTTYTPVQAEIDNGSMTLTLESTGNGSCLAVQDIVNITFTDSPTANAGADISICGNSNTLDLNGMVTVANNGFWTGGFGEYTPGDSLLSTTYIPNQADFDQGSITFILTTFDQGDCLAVTDTLDVDILEPAIVSAGEDLTPCISENSVNLSGSVTGITNTGVWSTLGSGTFSPDNSNLNGVYNISQADSIAGNVTLVLTSTNNTFCDAVTDTVEVNILPPGIALAGNDTTVCANNSALQLNGQIAGNASGGVWSSTGTGVFVPNENTLDATYIPSEGDAVNGTVTLSLTANSCDQAIDQLDLTIGIAPEATPGLDQVICSNQETIDLSGLVSGASTTGAWTTTGSGTFLNPITELNNTYEIDSLDIVNQEVQLILTATNTPGCVTVSDTLTIDIFQEAIVEAGPDTTLCANNGVIDLAGVISNGSGPKWVSSGTGTFSPSDDILNPQYIPSEADATAGFVSLVLSSEESCNGASDVININFTPAPEVEAGEDFVVCSSNTEFILNGSISGITTDGIWSTSGNGLIDDATDMNSMYTVSPEEQATGGVTIYLTSENNLNCLAVVDSVQIIYTEGIIANAGSDQMVCEGSLSTTLNGVISNGTTTGIWASDGTGTFDDPTNLAATYTFSQADSLAGVVTFTLESTNVGDCDVITDDITVTFGTNPTVDAGADIEICGQDSILSLNGFVSGGISGTWSTSGSGTFGNVNVMSTIYTLSQDDLTNGFIELTLTSETSGNCLPTTDQLTINVDPIPVVFAGEDVVICQLDSVDLNAVVAFAPNVSWTTNGTGNFISDSTLTNVYVPNIADSLAGSIEIYASSIGTTVCSSVTDTMTLFIGGGAIPNAGIDQLICADGQNVLLNGSIAGTGAVQWSSTGSGTFTPNDELITEYIPSSTDLLVGSVNLILETISGLGCAGGVDSTFIEFDPIPLITPIDDLSICESVDTILVSGIIANADSINWQSLGSGEILLNNLSEIEYVPSDGDITAGSVDLVVEAFSETLCSTPKDTLTIFFSSDLTADFEVTNICAGQEAEFTDMTTVMNGNAIGWSWDFGDGDTENNQNPDHIYTEPGDYQVSLTVFNSTGCSDNIVQTISVTDGPDSEFIVDEEANVGDQVNTVDLSSDAVEWAWNFGDGSSLNTNQNATHTYTSPGEFYVILEVTNALGCSDTTGTLVKIGGDFVFPPNLPNAFSPNGDGENDSFIVRGGPFVEIDFVVFNGWGQVIFETENPSEGWDGTHKGKDEPTGVYVYTVRATTIDGESFVKSGKVSLIR